MTDAQVELTAIEKAERRVIARSGLFLTGGPKDERPGAILTAFAATLRDDPRVRAVKSPTIDDQWSDRPVFWPTSTDVHDQRVLDGSDRFYGVQWSQPIEFTVYVPAKNQPLYGLEEAAPTETYEVSWDGVTAIVAWEQNTDPTALTGGQVVEQILRDGAREMGRPLYVQACNPGCTFLFVHTDFVGREKEGVDVLRAGSRSMPADYVAFEFEPSTSVREVATILYWHLRSEMFDFAEVKNVGQRIFEVETFARHRLDILFGYYQAAAEVAVLPWRERFRARYQMKGWRKRARYEVALLWRSISTLERLLRMFGQRLTDQRDWRSVFALEDVFKHDLAELGAIESLNLSILQQGTQHASDRLDNRSVAGATVWGAMAGGVVGAGLGGLF
ncbi:MAG TPA: hypothetical protein VK611_03245 [Acidimicrobiales bacterium]|nr:hypothetical protein [Acidimicrobiales bacterium]